MIVIDNNSATKSTITSNVNTANKPNANSIEEALTQLIQHAVIYEEAKNKLKLLS